MEQLAKLTCEQKREESVEPSAPPLSCESKKGGEKQTVGR